jgi:hypothetical protein
VQAGGGLAVVPGGDEMQLARYRDAKAARLLLPARYEKVRRIPAGQVGIAWDSERLQAPVKDWFEEWKRQIDPPVDFVTTPARAYRYWQMNLDDPQQAALLAFYDDPDQHPALLLRQFDPAANVRGHVVQFTTALDTGRLDPDSKDYWNNYLASSFYLSLVKRVVGYLSGDAQDANLNHLSRPQQAVLVSLPPEARFPNFVLSGPGLGGQAGFVARADNQDELRLGQAKQAGNYLLQPAADGPWKTGFSLNVPPEESLLNLKEALQSHWSQPIELLPYLMILVLLALALENLLANLFYRREARNEPITENRSNDLTKE